MTPISLTLKLIKGMLYPNIRRVKQSNRFYIKSQVHNFARRLLQEVLDESHQGAQPAIADSQLLVSFELDVNQFILMLLLRHKVSTPDGTVWGADQQAVQLAIAGVFGTRSVMLVFHAVLVIFGLSLGDVRLFMCLLLRYAVAGAYPMQISVPQHYVTYCVHGRRCGALASVVYRHLLRFA